MWSMMISALLAFAVVDACLKRPMETGPIRRLHRWWLPTLIGAICLLSVWQSFTLPHSLDRWLQYLPSLATPQNIVGMVSGGLFALWLRHRLLAKYQLPFGKPNAERPTWNTKDQPGDFMRAERWWLAAVLVPPLTLLIWPEIKQMAGVGIKTSLFAIQLEQVKNDSRVPPQLKREKAELTTILSPAIFQMPEEELEILKLLRDEITKPEDKIALEYLIKGNEAFVAIFNPQLVEAKKCILALQDLGYNRESIKPRVAVLSVSLFGLAQYLLQKDAIDDEAKKRYEKAASQLASILEDFASTLNGKCPEPPAPKEAEARKTQTPRPPAPGDYLALRQSPAFFRLIARLYFYLNAPDDAVQLLDRLLKKTEQPFPAHRRSARSTALLGILLSAASPEGRRAVEPYEKAIAMLGDELASIARARKAAETNHTLDEKAKGERLAKLDRHRDRSRRLLYAVSNNLAYALVRLGERMHDALRLSRIAFEGCFELSGVSDAEARCFPPAITDTHAYVRMAAAVMARPTNIEEIRQAKLLFDEAISRIRAKAETASPAEWKSLNNAFEVIRAHAEQAEELLATHSR